MKTFSAVRYMAVMLAVLTCIACSGGTNDMLAEGGIGGTGVISTGEVTAMGSVWVNGVEFNTQTAEVYVNNVHSGSGDQAIEDNLDPGRIVQVKGWSNEDGSGQADQVFYASTLIGPIDRVNAIDDYDTVIVILDQIVIVDDRTRMPNVDIGALAVGNLVEVSGFFDDAGRIQATFLTKTAEVTPADTRFRISGPISNLDKDDNTFFIGTLAIDYGTADVSGVNPEGLENCRFVSVTGQLVENIFRADGVNFADRLGDGGSDWEKVEIEGIVGSDLAESRFTIEGYLIETGADTLFVGGTKEDILPGSRIDVEGVFSNGIIAAEKIKFSQDFRAESDIAAVIPDSTLTLTLTGLESLTILINDLTRITGQTISMEDLDVGDHIKIKGRVVDGQVVVASQIIALPPDLGKISLRGTVSDVSEPMLSINGVVIDTRMIPSEGFYADDDIPISSDTFFHRVREGAWVEVKGKILSDGSTEWQIIALVQAF
jgi:hypothetical protein